MLLERASFRVKVISPLEKRRANKELIENPAEYFNKKKSNIKIIRGEFAREKLVEVIPACESY